MSLTATTLTAGASIEEHDTDVTADVVCPRCDTPGWTVKGECWCIICARPIDPADIG